MVLRYCLACSVKSKEGRVLPHAIIFHLTSNYNTKKQYCLVTADLKSIAKTCRQTSRVRRGGCLAAKIELTFDFGGDLLLSETLESTLAPESSVVNVSFRMEGGEKMSDESVPTKDLLGVSGKVMEASRQIGG